MRRACTGEPVVGRFTYLRKTASELRYAIEVWVPLAPERATAGDVGAAPQSASSSASR